MSEIQPLNFPKADLRLKRKDSDVYVWCILRKKELICTPEEWVRQHVIHFLINDKNIPEGLIASEYSLEYNGLAKRADIVVFDRSQKPVLIVECKATTVPITEKTLQQIAQYNFKLNVDYLFLTNGLEHVFCSVDKETGKVMYLRDLPDGSSLL
jgi:hypothetical protein